LGQHLRALIVIEDFLESFRKCGGSFLLPKGRELDQRIGFEEHIYDRREIESVRSCNNASTGRRRLQNIMTACSSDAPTYEDDVSERINGVEFADGIQEQHVESRTFAESNIRTPRPR
jgi:hypothetical protein